MSKVYFIKESEEAGDLAIKVGEFLHENPQGSDATKGYSQLESYLPGMGMPNIGEITKTIINITDSILGEIITLVENTDPNESGTYSLVFYLITDPTYNNNFSQESSKVIITNLKNNNSITANYSGANTIRENNLILFISQAYNSNNSNLLFPNTNEQVPIKLEFTL